MFCSIVDFFLKQKMNNKNIPSINFAFRFRLFDAYDDYVFCI